MDVEKPQTRRSFLDWIVAFATAVAVVATAIPSLMYLWPAARGTGAEKVEVEGAKGMAPGQSTMIQVGSLAVIIVRQRVGFRAFSAACTHLGCLVTWDSSNKKFLCPCHAAVFDENGHVVSGPPPAPLPELQVKEVGERVFVTAT